MSQLAFVIVTDEDTVDKLTPVVQGEGLCAVSVTQVQGLGGAVTDYLLVGTAASHIIHRICLSILPFIEARRVKSIKVGDVEVIGPRPQDVTRLLEQATRKTKKLGL